LLDPKRPKALSCAVTTNAGSPLSTRARMRQPHDRRLSQTTQSSTTDSKLLRLSVRAVTARLPLPLLLGAVSFVPFSSLAASCRAFNHVAVGTDARHRDKKIGSKRGSHGTPVYCLSKNSAVTERSQPHHSRHSEGLEASPCLAIALFEIANVLICPSAGRHINHAVDTVARHRCFKTSKGRV
jgi:hypothetical protein